ncbi:MAG: GTPase Era [Gammaproteobacteria bacterium]|nr:GTPase Era [Gammaproteobacteria bacterium]
MHKPHRFGYVALVGRPNVGKSTLFNRIVGQKISIVTRRAQTTRNRILGISTGAHWQIAFVDTPGMHLRQRGALNRYMNRTAQGALADVNLALFMVEGGRWTDEDSNVLTQIEKRGVAAFLLVNKVDRIKRKEGLLPFLEASASRYPFLEIVPVSALAGDNIERLIELIVPRLPAGEAGFPDDQITDKSVRFLAAETLREKLTRRLGDELPYGLGIEIEAFNETHKLTSIGAVVWVERPQHKPMVIGKGGRLLKRVGSDARKDLELLLDTHVYLRLWVKVRDGWSNDERALRQLGYHE